MDWTTGKTGLEDYNKRRHSRYFDPAYSYTDGRNNVHIWRGNERIGTVYDFFVLKKPTMPTPDMFYLTLQCKKPVQDTAAFKYEPLEVKVVHNYKHMLPSVSIMADVYESCAAYVVGKPFNLIHHLCSSIDTNKENVKLEIVYGDRSEYYDETIDLSKLVNYDYTEGAVNGEFAVRHFNLEFTDPLEVRKFNHMASD